MGSRGASFDFTWITSDLALGGRIPGELVNLLAQDSGIRRVIDLRAEEQDDQAEFRRCGVEVLHLPTPDLTPVPMEMISRGVNWAVAAIREGHRVLVHCEHGIGRSALLLCAVLIQQGASPSQALRAAKAARPRVCPNPEQLHALLDWTRTWCESNGRAVPPCQWADLAEIAYAEFRGRA